MFQNGFFSVDQPKATKPTRKAKSLDIANQPRGCDQCSLKENWAWIVSPQMPVSGNHRDGDILALGEAPGEQEDREGIAFIGRSGDVLRRAIPGRDMERVAFQNAVRCRPKDNATPSAGNVHACSIHLEADIEQLPLKAILGIGGVPLSRFWPGQNITRMHGVKFPVDVAGKTLWYYPILHPSFALRTGGDSSSAMHVLRSDVKTFFKEVDTWGEPHIWKADPADILMPGSEAEARYYLNEMRGPLGLDLETQKLKPYLKDAKLLTAAISDTDISIAFPIEHPENPTDWGLKLLLEIAGSRPWIAHNAVFELTWLIWKAREAGLSDWVPAPFDDSMACGRLYHRRETILSLDMLTRIHLGINIKNLHKLNLNNMIAEPLAEILPYNGLDAQSSALLFHDLRPRIDDDNYDRFVETIHSTARMEIMGLQIDLDRTAELKAHWQAINKRAQEDAKDIYEVRKFEMERQQEFNIASSEHVGIALVEYGKVKLPKTSKKGEDGKKSEGQQWSTDEAHLREHASDNPLALAALDYRESQKQISTYLESIEAICESTIDGLIHPSYTTLHTATTRLSSTEPNAQNFPKRRHRDLRSQVIPDRLSPDNIPVDHIFLAADMGQIDARIYGCATKDGALCDSFISGEDIHSFWRDRALALYPDYLDRLARKTNETDEAKILKGARDIIKSDFVFAAFYGSDYRACAARTGMPLDVTQDLTNEFWQRYPKALKWLKAQRQEYINTGSIRTLCGVERHGILWGNEVINTPIQGTTAHIVNDAQNALSRMAIAWRDPYLHPRINIHDDLTFVLPDIENEIDRYIKIIAAEMVRVRYRWQIVPFTVECKIGYDWADLEDVCVIKGDYRR